MASALDPEQRASYSAIIDDILAASDLNTVSAKRIRKGLQDKLGYDISEQKQAITDLIMERFDKFQAPSAPPATAEHFPTTNGMTEHTKKEKSTSAESAASATSASPSEPTSPAKRKADDVDSDDLSDVADPSPPKKAKRIQREDEEDDAAYARRLQAELNALNVRPTRGGGRKSKPAPKKAAKPKKKSKAKVGSDDDSEVDGEEKPEKEKKGGFHKQMTLSEPLAALLNTPSLSRPQTVKQIWAYVKERDLQDPNDKRQIRCDDAMRAVFKSEKVHMFTMNKVLAQHLFPMEEQAVQEE